MPGTAVKTALGPAQPIPVRPAGAEGERLRADVPPPAVRRPEIDLMRAFVVLGVIVLHSALIFSSAGLRIRNAETSVGFDLFVLWGLLWGMPLLFVVSGTAAWHALARRTAAGFVRERLQRLLVPGVFGLVAFVPAMWYLGRLRTPGFHESYGHFWLRLMEVPAVASAFLNGFKWRAGSEDFDYMHVWFLFALLLLSIVLLPPFLYLRSGSGTRFVNAVVAATQRQPVIVLMAGAVPFALLELAFGPSTVTGGWSWPAYIVPLALGYVLASDQRFDRLLCRARWWTLSLAVLSTVALVMWMALLGAAIEDVIQGRLPGWAGLQAVSGWAWILAILGFASSAVAHFGRPASAMAHQGPSSRMSRVARYLNEAVLPVYVLHLPVILAIAFFIVEWTAPMLVKYVALVLASLVLTMAIYDLLVRRFLPVRVLFGMKPRKY